MDHRTAAGRKKGRTSEGGGKERRIKDKEDMGRRMRNGRIYGIYST